MSSRRDSRVHLSIRQDDALLEFENFKRKYLLVNKHITKLNSTLSVRVEELNAQVSTLYVENLRLRASEIALVSQVKREKERAQRVVDEAEIAVGTLMGRLSDMRTSLSLSTPKNKDAVSSPRRKVPPSLIQPPRETVRLVRPPAEAITQIRESEEEEGDDEDITPTRTTTTRQPSTSRLPMPKFVPTPQSAISTGESTIPHINLAAGATKRKPARRNGALLSVERHPAVERASSPVAGPVRRPRRSSAEQEDEEREVELEVQVGNSPEVKADHQETPKIKDEGPGGLGETRTMEWHRQFDRKGKEKQVVGEREREIEIHSASEKDSSEGSKERTKEKEKRRFGIKDVTNSPRTGATEFGEEKPIEMPATVPSSTLSTPSSTATPLFDTLTPKPEFSLFSTPTTPATDGGSEAGESITGRERRTRKSVNYAEPKLNTKMRKPDPPTESFRARTSAGGTVTRRRRSIPTPNTVLASDEDGDADVEGSGSNTRWTEGRRKTVHNTSVNTANIPSGTVITATMGDSYGHWGDETRRHSMAV
ncbi:hypothetical protein JB92DRAFT_3145075 [Gautieria morchelliformis]|nr:hypothetical protein JB92DRAFT_3145075 [Gautieria morchelliformis]